MLSRENATYLFDHVLDGFESSHRGIEELRRSGLIDQSEYTDLLEKNTVRLIDRIKEFKICQRLTCILFACVFTWMQVAGEDMAIRKPVRVRVSSKRVEKRR